jgi:HEAT repeat protein
LPEDGRRQQVDRHTVRNQVSAGDYDRLAERAVRQHRVERWLVALLYDEDAETRRRAAEALGVLAGRRPERARPLADRLWWALNDESATYCPGAPLGIARIAVAQPDIMRPLVRPLVHLLDDEGLLPGVLAAITLVAAVFPEAVADLEPALGRLAQDGPADARRLALDALASVRGTRPPASF